MSDTAPQPPPVRTESEPIYKQVIADIEAKAEVGHAKYGTYLQADNGRDHLADAYQESIDKTKYLKAAIVERRALLDRIAALEAQLAEAQARLAMVVEALNGTLGELQAVQATCALSGLPAKAWAGFGGKAKKALDATADSVAQHTASVERRGAAKALEQLATYWEDEGYAGSLTFRQIAAILREGADSVGAALGIIAMRDMEREARAAELEVA